jgi:hypothetical protein
VEKWTRDEKMAYYFWLDELTLRHWGEYLDLKLDEDNDDEGLCQNKLKLIDYYQSLLDEVGREFEWEELDRWFKEKYGEGAAFIRFYKDMFLF